MARPFPLLTGVGHTPAICSGDLLPFTQGCVRDLPTTRARTRVASSPPRFHWLTRALPSQSVNRTYSEGSLCPLITGPNYWKPITAGTLRPLFKAWMTCDSRPHRSSEYAPSAKTRVAPATHLGRRTAWPPLSRQFRQLKLITTRAHPPRTEAALPFSLSYSHPFSLSYSQMCTLDKSSRVHLGP